MASRRAGPVRALAALLIAASGCGDVRPTAADGGPDAGGGDGGPGGIDAAPPSACEPGGDPGYDEAWDCIEDSACGLVARCLAPFELADCRRLELTVFDEPDRIEIERLREGIEQGTVVYHPDRVADCVTALADLSCAFLIQSGGRLSDVCPIFTGAVATGEDCYSSIECEEAGAQCGGASLCTDGDLCCLTTCLSPVPLDGDCTGEVQCEPGTHCVSGVCRTGETGAQCVSSSDCDLDFWCDAGTCAPDAASGGACTAEEQCPPPEGCLGNDLGPPGEGTCGRSDRVGDACDGICFGLICDRPAVNELGVCASPGEEGDSCTEFDVCEPAFRCDADAATCVPLGDAGDDCLSTPDCRPGLVCDTDITGKLDGQCVGPLETGATCAQGTHCQSGICNPATFLCEDFPGCYP